MVPGLRLRKVRDIGRLNALRAIAGVGDQSSWGEVLSDDDEDFSSYFDSYFQSLEGRDPHGRSFLDLMTLVTAQAATVVLSYGPVDSEIDVFASSDAFRKHIVDSYASEPVELHLAWDGGG